MMESSSIAEALQFPQEGFGDLALEREAEDPAARGVSHKGGACQRLGQLGVLLEFFVSWIQATAKVPELVGVARET